jgi:hypothetical protein
VLDAKKKKVTRILGGKMKTGIFSKYATLAALSASVIALNNCGHRTDSTSDQSYTAKENGSASDLAILSIPPNGYPVAGGVYAPSAPIETNCNDGVDNDGDGLVDCMDTDCQIHPECSEFGPPISDIINSRATTIYPNGILIPEDVAFLKVRGVRADDSHHWQRTEFFPSYAKDCWVRPLVQDPYYNIDLNTAAVAGHLGAVGPGGAYRGLNAFGPRAGLINECEPGTDLFEYFMDNDDGPGDGGSGDSVDNDHSDDEDSSNEHTH